MSKKNPTKYKITEKVYYLEDNKVKEANITGIYISTDEKEREQTWYAIQKFQSPPSGDKNWIAEKRIFKTKVSLLNSL